MKEEELIKIAISYREKAYAPYSNFKVGSAVLCEDGIVYGGCNIENASYGGTNCAERTAIFKAVSEGAKTIEAIAIVGDFNNYTYPCGICRQVIVEFSKEDTKIYCAKNENDYKKFTINELLPGAFTKEALK